MIGLSDTFAGMKRISATEASRNFSRVIDAAAHRGESFVVERNGEPVVEIRPARRPPTVADALAYMRRAPIDLDFVRDVEDVIAERQAMPPVDRWAGKA